MAKTTEQRSTVFKKTRQGGSRPKTSSMNKTQKNTYKKYRGQGR